jgi:F0F1-type ATP synthase membrane subunit b/b'
MAPSPGGGLEGLWQDEYRRLVRTINQLADRVGEGFHRVRKELEKAENELEKTRQTVLTILGNAKSAFSEFTSSLSDEYAKELERKVAIVL